MSTEAKAKDPDRELIVQEAKDAVTKAGNKIHNAKILLAKRAKRHEPLRKALLENWLERICYEEVRHLVGDGRSILRQKISRGFAGAEDRALKDGGLLLVAKTNADLMTFALWGGKPLGEGTREEIQESANKYAASARTSHVTGRWLALVAQGLPSDKTAKDHFKNERLLELRWEAERDDN